MARPNIPRVCPQCSTPFLAERERNVFCSKRCANHGRHPPDSERFMAFVAKREGDGCWLWEGNRRGFSGNRVGYGSFSLGGREESAHRVSWILFRGEIPKEQQVLHRCDVTLCVRPTHLFLGDQKENVRDMVVKKRNRPCRGELNVFAKLNECDVLQIRASLETNATLSTRFNVTQENISMIRKRKTWKHLGASA